MFLTCFGSLCGGSLIIDLVWVATLFNTLNEVLLQMPMPMPTPLMNEATGTKEQALVRASCFQRQGLERRSDDVFEHC